MSRHQKKLEMVLEYLINNEIGKAEKVLHQVVVEKSRSIYSNIVNEEFGGDPKSTFADRIQSGKNEVDAEATYEDEDSEDDFSMDSEDDMGTEDDSDMGDDTGEEEEFDFDGDDGMEDSEATDVEQGMENLESAFAALAAELDALQSIVGVGSEDDMDAEDDADSEDDAGFDVDSEDDTDSEYEDDADSEDEYVGEATTFHKNVADLGMGTEGKELGKGGTVKVNTNSIVAKRSPSSVKSVNFSGNSAENGYKAPSAKDDTPSNNVKLAPKSAPKAVKPTDDKSAGSPLNGVKGRQK